MDENSIGIILDMVFMVTVAKKWTYKNQSLATIAVVLLSNQKEDVIKLWV